LVLILIGVGALLCCCILLLVGALIRGRRKKSKKQDKALDEIIIPMDDLKNRYSSINKANYLTTIPARELNQRQQLGLNTESIEFSEIKLENEIGRGAFGVVFK
jgi:hypothetical protein